jgi:phenylalanyl-tRNA synthetase alpha chain
MLTTDLEKIKKEFEDKFSENKNSLENLEKLRIDFLGRKSNLNEILKGIKDLTSEEKKQIGPLANKTRKEIEEVLVNQIDKLKQQKDLEKEWIDVTVSRERTRIGSLNLLTKTQRDIEKIFTSMGFEVADGPEMENEWYNFDALNIPKDHPARDLWDTFWLKNTDEKGGRLLLRTHTSNAQVRYMEKNKPPFQIVVPGKAYRYEATDANHEHSFCQFEALVVGDEVNVANFKSIAQDFFTAFFQEEIKVRLRPSYFPFTEPSFEFDISCRVCQGQGCSTCSNTGWLEMGGCGMVNQRVFEAAGYPKDRYQGFAWGFGIERLAMMKHKVDDIRLFRSGDLRFIRQF